MKKATLESTARDAICERTASQIYKILEKRELTYREVLRSLAGARTLAATNAKLNKQKGDNWSNAYALVAIRPL